MGVTLSCQHTLTDGVLHLMNYVLHAEQITDPHLMIYSRYFREYLYGLAHVNNG